MWACFGHIFVTSDMLIATVVFDPGWNYASDILKKQNKNEEGMFRLGLSSI